MLAFLLALVLAFAVLATLAPSRAEFRYPRLFGYGEVRSTDLRAFPKWRGTLERYFRDRKLENGSCRSTLFNRCHLRDWQRFLAGIRALDRKEQLRRVNAYMNRAPYITDPVNYHMTDYWATPRQFFIKNGDCEDYAIAKYLSLRALGYPTEALRIVVLYDENLRLAHAVLAVYGDDDIWILDNQIPQVVAASRIRHYRPIYSINETAWWLHRGQRQAGPAGARR